MKRRITYAFVAVYTGREFGGGRAHYHSPVGPGGGEGLGLSRRLELFSYVLEKVRKDYVDGKKADPTRNWSSARSR